MKILLGNFSFSGRTGSELFTLETALGLRRRGHEVAVLCSLRGPLAGWATRAGVEVGTRVGALRLVPEVMHANSRTPSRLVGQRWPELPQLAHIHGSNGFAEDEPAAVSLRRVLVMAPSMVRWMAPRWGLQRGDFAVEAGGVDLRRFALRASPGGGRRRVLLYSRYLGRREFLEDLRRAVRRAGMELDTLESVGGQIDQPEELLPRYDLVLAAGRSAREAACCGCAVMPFFGETLDPWISPARYPLARFHSFCTVPYHRRTPPARLEERLAAVNFAEAEAVAQHTRADYDFEQTLTRLEAEFAALAARPVLHPRVAPPRGVEELLRERLRFTYEGESLRLARERRRREKVEDALRKQVGISEKLREELAEWQRHPLRHWWQARQTTGKQRLRAAKGG